MTPANQKKFKAIGERLISLSKENGNAQTSLYVILDVIATLTQMATDFHFRPEVNS